LASWGLVFWDSAFSLLICSWFGVSQCWSFWSLWGWVFTTENPSHYLELVKALSDKYKVTITVRKEIANGALVEWLSKTLENKDPESSLKPEEPNKKETTNREASSEDNLSTVVILCQLADLFGLLSLACFLD
jgi:hypothetical protein